MTPVRIGIVGLGKNTRKRHVPGLRECDNVQLVAVCNRRPESTQQVAVEFNIPKTYAHWEEVVQDPDVDAVMIGTWPYLHCPITLAALDAGKHVLTEARMARSLAEARQMFQASQQHPDLVTQIVPSPFGFRGGQTVQQLIADGFLGDLRELVITGLNADFADPEAPLHWRQSAQLSGVNMLALGILHETLIRWVPDPEEVCARMGVFTAQRLDPLAGNLATVDRPDTVHVSTVLPGGACGLYHLSGALHHAPGFHIHLYGSEGTLQYDLTADRLWGGRRDDTFREIEIAPDREGKWRVEADFVDAIRGGPRPRLTDFATGLRYMEFTEAVEQSAREGTSVSLPLEDVDA